MTNSSLSKTRPRSEAFKSLNRWKSDGPGLENMVGGTVVRSRIHGLQPWQRGTCVLAHCRGEAALAGPTFPDPFP